MTSGSTDFSLTRDQIIQRALRLIGVLAQGETPTTDQVTEASIALNALVKAWQADGMPLWAIKTYAVTLSAGTNSYEIGLTKTVNTAKPLKIIRAWYRNSYNVDTPVRLITKDEYDRLGNKSSAGTVPSQLYYQPLIDSGMLYVYPTPDSGTTGSLYLVYQRPFEDFDTSTDTPDFPQEWYDAVTYGLACRLAPEYGLPAQDRKMLWQEMTIIKNDALGFGTEEGSLYFGVERRG